MTERRFKTPLYGIGFTVIIYDSPEELREKFKGVEFNHDIESFDGGVFELEDHHYLVLHNYIYKKIPYPTPGIIAHEAKHLVNRIFGSIGQELDLHNDEAECYLLGWIVDRVHELNKKHLNDKK